MNAVVIDTNIIFSILLGKNRKFRDVLFSSGDHTFLSPKFVIVELFKYKEKIMHHSSLAEDEVLLFLYSVLKRISFFEDSLISDESLRKAHELCKDIDEKDTVFVALAMELDGLLWTGDRKLKEGLRRKGMNMFFEV